MMPPIDEQKGECTASEDLIMDNIKPKKRIS